MSHGPRARATFHHIVSFTLCVLIIVAAGAPMSADASHARLLDLPSRVVPSGHAVHETIFAEVMIDESFSVKMGEKLLVNIPDADVVLTHGSGDVARIVVTLEGRNMDKAREYYAKQKISAQYSGSVVSVISEKSKRERSFRLTWNSGNNNRIVVTAYIPERFDVDVSTSDGDVNAGRLQGEVSLRTSDGNVIVDEITGSSISVRTSDGDVRTGVLSSGTVRVRTSDGSLQIAGIESADAEVVTSDGNIRLERLEGSGDVRTSDGSIEIDFVNGDAVSVRTSDGDINIGSASVAQMSVKTSDGSIRIDGIDGTVDASSSDGDIYIQFDSPSAANVRVSDGDIIFVGANSLGVDLDLTGENVRVASSFDFQGRLQKRSADGQLNGGGPIVRGKSSDGTVYFRSE